MSEDGSPREASASKNILLAKNDLHVMKGILYDTGSLVGAKNPILLHNMWLKLELG